MPSADDFVTAAYNGGIMFSVYKFKSDKNAMRSLLAPLKKQKYKSPYFADTNKAVIFKVRRFSYI